VPGYFGEAEPFVECPGAVVDGENVQDEILAPAPGFGRQGADQASADAKPLVAGVDLDAGQVDQTGPVLDAAPRISAPSMVLPPSAPAT